MYKKVYSPEGEMFEVPQHIFEDVVLNKGWTQTPQAAVAPAKPLKVVKEEKSTRREPSKASVKKAPSKESTD